ncbi:MAG TPA: L,D-transpeptidase [Gaiellaceae bacterium]
MKRIALIAALPLAAAACGGTQRATAPEQHVKAAHVVRCAPGYRPVGSSRLAYAAVVLAHATARRTPAGARLADFGPVTVNDYPTVLGVRGKLVRRDCSVRWWKVQLPLRPNGVTGWVRPQDVAVERVRTRILVDVSARRVTLYRAGRRVLSTAAAVGAPATPTPTGSYYVNQRLVPADTHGPFGPGAIGISAFSPVLTGWAQGGPVAIHGTDAPWSIGHAVSNGCIRVPNPVLTRMFRLAVAGTPVIIRP